MHHHYHAATSIGLKLCYLLVSVAVSQSLPDGDLCKWMNGRKYYIEVGESGIISVENATSALKGETNALVSPGSQPQIPQRCSVELITCPSCHLQISILHLNIPTCSADENCRCDFVWIKESAYSKSGREYCGIKDHNSSDILYESKTKLVSIDFLYSGSYSEAFALQFSAKKNVYVYKGGYTTTGFIQSPNFPGGYPSDYSAEFVLQHVDNAGFVQLIFIDFQLSLWSFIEVFDSNGTRIDIYNGNIFRPPAIISSGPVLTVKFQANDEYPSSGFQAKYTFVSYPEKYWTNKPSTDCGGFVEDYGGAITMMNMVPSNTLQAFDCIWLIRPRNSHVPDTQVAIRVAQFEEMGPKSVLTIRQGLNSDAPLLEAVNTYHHLKMPRGQEYVVSATSGFYIRLVGYFTNKSQLAIIYTTFRYEGCYGVADFECDNRRCVKNVLRCDGFNHCGDGSDESACYGTNQGTTIPEDANWWRTLTPNYYFPKPDSNSGAGTNTLILVTSLAGLGMFVLTTVMILVKLHRQRQDDTISREILHTVSGDIDMDNSPGHHHGLSDLPLYDPPPSYEEVIKLYLPPPPPYSAIGHGRTRTNRTRPNGVENRAYRNDSPHGAREQSRRVRQSRNATQDSTHPLILKVSLPEEGLVRRGDGYDHVVGPSNVPSRNVASEHLQRDAGTSSASKESPEDSASRCASSPIKTKNKMNFSAIDVIKESEAMTSCECQGACSCRLINPNKQVKRSSSETKVAICGNGLAVDKMQVSKKRSFKDMMQKSIKRAASSAMIPHPTSMTITVRPSRTKKPPDQSESKSGPSSPTSPVFPDTVESEKTQSCDVGHRRSSSGPIRASESHGDVTAKAASEDGIAGQAALVSQSTSVLIDVLHHSLSTRSGDLEGKLPRQRSDLNVTSHGRVELGTQCKPKVDSLWISSDTRPLLNDGSPQPVIVEFGNRVARACGPLDAKATNENKRSQPRD